TRYSIYQKNTYRIEGKTVHMDMRNRYGEVIAVTTFNVEHLERVTTKKWRYTKGYVSSFDISLHRFITNANSGEVVDHANHNPLDNTDENLRIGTQQNNMHNSSFKLGRSGYRGVQCDVRRKHQ